MTSQRELEKTIAAEVDQCLTSKKQATIGNFIFRRKSAWQGDCEAAVRGKYANELAAFAAEDDRVNQATTNAFLQIGSANIKMYLIAGVGFLILIAVINQLKNS